MIRWKIFRNKRECSDEKLHSNSLFIRKMDVMEKRFWHKAIFGDAETLDRVWEYSLEAMEFSNTITTENILYND